MSLFNDKRWEMVLAALMPLVLPLVDAYQSGQFNGKSVVSGIILGAIIALRAAASQRQSPPAPPAV